MGKQWTQWLTLSFWAPKSLQMVIAAMKLKDATWKKSYDQPRQHIKKQRYYFANKGPSSQGYGFSSSHVWMWELSAEELMLLNYCVGEDCWESLGLQGDLTSPSKGDQSWVFIGRSDVGAETPILWPPDAKSWLIEKDHDAGKDWGRKRSWWQKMRWLDGITDSMDMGLGGLQTHGSWWWRRPGVLWFMGLQKVRHDWATELYWTETVLKVLLGSC